MRDVLLADAQSLIKRGILPQESVAEVSRSQGHQQIAVDLMRLVQLFRERRPDVELMWPQHGKDLEQATAAADQIFQRLGTKKETEVGIIEMNQLRQRAYALLYRVYDDITRIVTFVRWQKGDAATLVPSLYTCRKTAKRKSTVSAEPQDDAQPDAPSPPFGTGPIPTGGESESPAVSTTPDVFSGSFH